MNALLPPAMFGLSGTTVRWRTALAATGVVAVVLAVAGFGLIMLQQTQLESTLRDLANQQALDVSAQIARHGVEQTDISRSGSSELTLIQIVEHSTGRVVASSDSITGEPPVVDLRPPPGVKSSQVSSSLPISDGTPYVVVARGVSAGGAPVVVIAAQSLEPVLQAREVTSGIVAVGYLPLLAVVAAISYWLTGRALAPVHRIRRQVECIGGDQLERRVPVPAAEDEISALARTMNDMLERLQRAAIRQRHFVADASHELRSPLASIRAAHDVAQSHHAAMSTDELHLVVGAELDRLQLLVDDLLTLASTDARGLSLAVAPVDLHQLLQPEVDQPRGSGVTVSLTAEPATVSGDRHLLTRALRNLTDNAARHAETRIDLSLHQEGCDAVVRVLDDGPGIPAQDHERVFERFVRLDPSRARTDGGTGLGLPIAREIARAHGGSLRVVSSERGALFEMRLPCSS